MTNSIPGATESDARDLPAGHEHPGAGHHHRRRKKKRLSRRARLKLRYAFVLALLVCVGLGYLLYNLNKPPQPTEKFDAGKYRNEFLKPE